ncbi:MAG: sulfite exporter TauE/SafE family protein [Bacteroidota bacterium]
MDLQFLLLISLLALVAFLYSSVGHGGASGYLAVMAMVGIAPSLMKSSALVMNLAVSLISFIGFYRAGHFRLKLFLPFIILSIPMAFLGGTMVLPDSIYKKILAVCLFIAIIRLVVQFKQNNQTNNKIPLWAGLLSGGLIGLVSGMIGIGGGILLSPLMLLMRWASLKETAAVSALFIFVNSLSGLFGQMQKGGIHLTDHLQYAIVFTVMGGIAGSYFGSKKFNLPTLRCLLAIGLVIASFKLMLT